MSSHSKKLAEFLIMSAMLSGGGLNEGLGSMLDKYESTIESTCPQCGRTFSKLRTSQASFCSAQCGREAEQARKAQVRIEAEARREEKAKAKSKSKSRRNR